MRKKKSTNQKKANADAAHYAEENYTSVPHTFVFHRGQIGKNVGQLVLDMRRVMEPFTARTLKVRKKNVLKDFVSVAGPLGVTHFSVFTKTNHSINMRLARLPKGPTLSFRVLKYTLIKDVVSSLKRHRMHGEQFTHHPLLVLNNFSTEGMQIKLMATMFQNMFPSINVHQMSLNSVKRCVLLNYDPVSQEIEFRHYNLKVVPVGMSRGVKKLLQEKFPNMSKLDDISELLTKGINLSESEAEQDGDHNLTELPQVYAGRGNMASQQSAVRLTEIGPRMTLRLVKITEGMGEGKVLYHSFITKTEKELQEIIKRKEARLKVKEERRKKQEENVALKKEIYGANRKKSLEAMKRKREQEAQVSEDDVEDPGNQEEKAPAEESEDEAEYYRQAVGEEPEEDMFPAGKRKRGPGKSPQPFKKRKSTQGKTPPQDKQKLKSPHRGNKEAGKRFGDRKAPDGKKRFRKSDGGKNFGKKREMGNRFAGKRKGETDKRFGRRNTSKARPAMKGQKNSRGTKEFRRKKGKS